ncbi:TetR/AcrR family transcriptional regulator [Paenibacillus sp. NEAU-GSW1]|uniref:TetR/AcrR family transcriptional regulator n=1 Tax=Paenibacillus sp. NEAU-GSW1 TaxID=2682486 RepID=UPI0012E32404|nr:TetR/AcrR family transcriptional regulator [Paenibacillus sp. NEAU-GSW1]MUT66853.1 TetR family transcriptional regulator [Paenibacillus sp. NEAU-GSW1]
MNKDKPRIDPRIIRTRQLLKDAFVELLQEMDIEKITVNRIAERATVNRVTFYLHYRDIPDMLEKLADEMSEEIRTALDSSMMQPNATERVDYRIMVGILEHIAQNAKFYKVVLGSRRTPIFTERLLKMMSETILQKLEHEKETSISRAGIQKDIFIWYSSAALIGTIVSWLRHDMPYTPEYLAQQFSLLRSHQV